MPFDKRCLVIPDDTKFEEHTVLTTGDVILGNHAALGFGVKTAGRVFLGESAAVQGHLASEGDVRVDMFSRIEGDIVSGGSVYLGEGARVSGKLSLKGDLDVGDDVQIGQGFEAKGWINIRHPIPMVIYLFLYLLEMLRLGRSEEVERILREMEVAQQKDIDVAEVYLYVPDGCTLGLQDAEVKGPMRVGKGCRILGNFAVRGAVTIGAESKVIGAVRCTGAFSLGPGSEVQGSVEAAGHASVGEGSKVGGDLRGRTVELAHSAAIGGTLTAPGGVRFVTPQQRGMEDKLQRFAAGQFEDVKDLLH